MVRVNAAVIFIHRESRGFLLLGLQCLPSNDCVTVLNKKTIMLGNFLKSLFLLGTCRYRQASCDF